jgi:hypothetical protein
MTSYEGGGGEDVGEYCGERERSGEEHDGVVVEEHDGVVVEEHDGWLVVCDELISCAIS